jgi:hypothetical protein
LYKAGIEDPTELYFFDARRVLTGNKHNPAAYFPEKQRHLPPLYNAVVPQVFFMRHFCEAVLKMTEFDFAVQYFPELRFLVSPSNHAILKVRQCHSLLRKLAKEVIRFLDSRPRDRNG